MRGEPPSQGIFFFRFQQQQGELRTWNMYSGEAKKASKTKSIEKEKKMGENEKIHFAMAKRRRRRVLVGLKLMIFRGRPKEKNYKRKRKNRRVSFCNDTQYHFLRNNNNRASDDMAQEGGHTTHHSMNLLPTPTWQRKKKMSKFPKHIFFPSACRLVAVACLIWTESRCTFSKESAIKSSCVSAKTCEKKKSTSSSHFMASPEHNSFTILCAIIFCSIFLGLAEEKKECSEKRGCCVSSPVASSVNWKEMLVFLLQFFPRSLIPSLFLCVARSRTGNEH